MDLQAQVDALTERVATLEAVVLGMTLDPLQVEALVGAGWITGAQLSEATGRFAALKAERSTETGMVLADATEQLQGCAQA